MKLVNEVAGWAALVENNRIILRFGDNGLKGAFFWGGDFFGGADVRTASCSQ